MDCHRWALALSLHELSCTEVLTVVLARFITAFSRAERSVHSGSESHLSLMPEVDLEQLRMADSCACLVAISPSTVMHLSAGLVVFAAKALKRVNSSVATA